MPRRRTLALLAVPLVVALGVASRRWPVGVHVWDKSAGGYRCGDGNWVRIHTNFPHHRDGVLKLLQCEHSREAVIPLYRAAYERVLGEATQ